jgi:hypothetical protein
MPNDSSTKAALNIGRKQARNVLKFREEASQERRKIVAERAMTPGVAALATTQVLVAEGDSWFDYPWTDVLRILEDTYLYDVESVAHKGDRIEDMAYSGGQLEEFARRLEKLLERNTIPRAILLSGGGNDVAGPEFGMLLDHAQSAAPGLNQLVVQGVMERIRLAYITILSSITNICSERGHPRIPIIIHGYDYPVPDGRGFFGGWGFLPGPWLEPGFREKGYTALAQRKQIAKDLLDRFNTMLSTLPAIPQLSHVRYVDLRNTLSTGSSYKTWWENELHPTPKGFADVVAKFSAVLTTL